METTHKQVLTVSELTARIKRLLEGEVGTVWLAGELTNLRRQSSGHVYFSLKDAESAVGAVLFRGDALKQSTDLRQLKDGVEVLVQGRLGVYEARGTYQLIVRTIQLQGQGRLQVEFERLKRELQAEGLFDPERKKALPALAGRIGVLTSASGAALQDFLSILERRGFSGEVLVFPSLVQGEGAAASLVKQLERTRDWNLDLVVLTRGGGSLEDLWCFNEEVLVRALARCPHPTISAVGHQIDFTLCDFAADHRCETPSGAAELISSSALALRERYAQAQQRLRLLKQHFFERKHEVLLRLTQGLFAHSPRRKIEHHYLRLDELLMRLQSAFEISLRQREQRLRQLTQRWERLPLKGQLVQHAARLEHLAPLLSKATAQALKSLAQHLDVLKQRLATVSCEATLARGYALVTTLDALPVQRAQEAQPGTCLTLRWADATRSVNVLE